MERLNILLVDDQPAKLLTYEAMLADMGQNLVKAHTAREALAFLLRDEVAVVLMDVNMPELDGFELAAMIRQHPRCRKTAIIFVSAVHLTDVDRLRGYETGAVDYVSVPVVPEILRAKIGVFLDLYRKTTELERLNQTLEARVSERTAELERSVRQLRESEQRLRQQGDVLADADRRKNQFLAMLAHELRNPLQPIRNAVALARQDGIAVDDLRWGRTVIERQVDQLVRLVDDLLDASRISSGKLALRRAPIDLDEILATALDSVRPLAEAKRQHIAVTPSEGPVLLDADGVRLTQVFFNLLNNACKYTPPEGRVSLVVERDGDAVEVRIRDDGAGIDAEDLPRVFEMFFQGGDRADDAQSGLGLGLALVQQLVELHGGTVRAASEGRARGSEFVVRLPVRAPAAVPAVPARAAPPDAEPASPRSRRVLVVDDNRDAADSLAMMLRFSGHEVGTVYDGAGAVDLIAQFRPEVVLMDLGMPRLDGYDAARAIRGMPDGDAVVLVAVTGWGGEADRQRATAAGFDHHLVKPVLPSELLQSLPTWERRAPQPTTVQSGGR